MPQLSKPAPLEVVVLAGGQSAERDVSLASGCAVVQALRRAGHAVAVVDPLVCDLARCDWSAVDVCFIALHGGAGEDGRVQRALERLGVAYTGSGPEASRLAMDKPAAKARFVAAGLPTPEWRLAELEQGGAAACRPSSGAFRRIEARVAKLGYPVVVKPCRQGSSLGVGFAANRRQLAECIGAAVQFGPRLFVERRIVGRELTVAVLDRRALPPLEIVARGEFYDYQAKYHRADTQYRFDLDLPRRVLRDVAALARRAAAALGTCGLVRVDLMLDADLRPWLLEVNTVPGMTQRSLAPRAAARAGIEMPELCDLIARRAIARHRARKAVSRHAALERLA